MFKYSKNLRYKIDFYFLYTILLVIILLLIITIICYHYAIMQIIGQNKKAFDALTI